MPFVMRMSILKSYRELKILAWQLNKIFQDFHLKFVAFITILLNALINDFFGMFLRRFKGNSAVVWPALGSIDLGPDHTSAESCSFLQKKDTALRKGTQKTVFCVPLAHIHTVGQKNALCGNLRLYSGMITAMCHILVMRHHDIHAVLNTEHATDTFKHCYMCLVCLFFIWRKDGQRQTEVCT